MEPYQELLNLALEIEGLICLLRERGDNAPQEARSLLAQKIQELSQAMPVANDPVSREEAASVIYEEHAAAQPVVSKADKPVAIEIPKTDDQTTGRPDDLLSLFSINDKFRFRRELFGNSDAAFQDAIDTISVMTSIDEVEDYLYNDLVWDQESPEVQAFLAVVSKKF